jgi:hypothetical protein
MQEFSISNFLKQPEPIKKRGSERTDILRQIYSFYDTEQEKIHTKKENWKRYVKFCKDNKLCDSKENQMRFKKSKNFIKHITDKSMASFWLSHIPTKHLYYILSVAKDKSFRNESVGAFICGATRVKLGIDNKV